MNITNLQKHNKIVYNGYTFSYTTLLRNQQMQYAKDGHSQLGIKRTYTVRGIQIIDDADNVDVVMSNTRLLLQDARKELIIYKEDGDVLERVKPQFGPGSTKDVLTDIDYGPKPISLDISKFTDRSFFLEWTVEFTVKECNMNNDVGAAKSEFLENNSRTDFIVDQAGYVSRTISGRTTSMVTGTNANYNIDDYRASFLPPELTGWKRLTIGVKISEDKLAAEWTVVDKQLYRVYPAPVHGGMANWRVTTEGLVTTIAIATLTGVYDGVSPEVSGVTLKNSKALMYQEIINLATQYFRIGTGDFAIIWQKREIDESIFENKLSFNFVAEILNAKQTVKGSVAVPGVSSIGDPVSKNVTKQTIPLYGNGQQGTTVENYVLHTPCITSTPQTVAYGNKVPGRQIFGSSPTTVGGTILDSGVSISSPIQKTNPYLDYEEVISYELDYKVRVFHPKDPTKDSLIQRYGKPVINIIQAGFARQQNAIPSAPPPIIDYPSAVLKNSSVSAPNVVYDSLNGDIASISWRYLIELVDNFTEATAMYPDDPRVTKAAKLMGVKNVVPDYENK